MHRHRSVLRVTFLLLALLVAFLAGQMSAAQPMMQNALGNLKQARGNLNKATAEQFGVEPGEGVIVTEVEADSLAATQGG